MERRSNHREPRVWLGGVSDLVWATTIGATIAAIPPTLAVIVAYRKAAAVATTRANDAKEKAVVVEGKVDEVHKLANDRLSAALQKIEDLTLIVDRLTVERTRPQ